MTCLLRSKVQAHLFLLPICILARLSFIYSCYTLLYLNCSKSHNSIATRSFNDGGRKSKEEDEPDWQVEGIQLLM